jgi:hypothetical protein
MRIRLPGPCLSIGLLSRCRTSKSSSFAGRLMAALIGTTRPLIMSGAFLVGPMELLRMLRVRRSRTGAGRQH